MARNTTYQEIADELGLGHRERVREYKAKGMPVTSVDAARSWYGEHVRPVAAEKESPNDETPDGSDPGAYQRKLIAEARCKEADAQRKELDYRERVGQLVERDAAHRTLRQMICRIVSRLQSIPDELAATVEPGIRSQVAADHRERIRLILLELAEMGKEFNE